MDRILHAIITRQNALLESPTGTGKTLALLCSILAWKKQQRESKDPPQKNEPKAACVPNQSKEEYEPNSDDDFQPVKITKKRPKTESKSNGQESSETLKEAPQRIYYATRTHSQRVEITIVFTPKCLNHPTKRQNGMFMHLASHFTSKKQLEKSRGCEFKKNTPKLVNSAANDFDVWDIEDLVTKGNEVKGCPYFASHSLAKMADIIFCPYSYLLDPATREALDIDLQGAIVIFDEAHNIEDAARESASFESDVATLQETVEQLQALAASQVKEHYKPIYEMMQSFVAYLQTNVDTLLPDNFETHTNCWSSDETRGILAKCGITGDTLPQLRKHFVLALKESANLKNQELKLKSSMLITLEEWFYTLDFFFDATNFESYKLVVQKVPDKSRKAWSFVVGLWCMSPAVAFSSVAKNTRTIILTSGTLSPMESFSGELGVNFQIKLEANHVINTSKQVWVGAISKGSDGTPLNSTFKNAETYSYQDAVGKAVFEYCNVIPHGVLCFFPSYQLMDKMLTRWKVTGMYDQIAHTKKVFVETSYSDNFATNMTEYYDTIKQDKGALLFAVCRGKVSEGLDFRYDSDPFNLTRDNQARGLIAVGIPFPLVKDLKIVLKKEFNDSKHQSNPGILTGSAWYTLQAFRALNQALGRVVRHSRDFGVVILLDDRFAQLENIGKLSKWLRTSSQQITLQQSLESVSKFFKQQEV